MTARAVVLGVVLIVVNAFWIYHMEVVRYSPETTTVALVLNAVMWLIALLCLNVILERYFPRAAFTRGELMVVYVMMALGAAICGLEFLETLLHVMGHPTEFETPENDWANLLVPHLPDWLLFTDKKVVEKYYFGDTTLYRREHIEAVLRPALAWGLFAFLLVGAMAFTAILFRSQWIHAERLTYPITQIPLEMTRSGSDFFRNRSLWVTFFIVLGFQMANGLYFFVPAMPHFPIWYIDIGDAFRDRPWSAMGLTVVGLHPIIIGLVYFAPVDLAFSSWFFLLMWKAELVLRDAMSWPVAPGMAFAHQASGGAYIAIALIAIWASRRRLWAIAGSVFRRPDQPIDDGEPIRFRTAALGLVVCVTGLLIFCVAAGMSLWVAAAFFLIYGAVSICVSRLRAELGAPVHYFPEIGPTSLLRHVLGTRPFTRRDLGMMALLRWFSLAHRTHPMPHQMEAFKIAERVRIDNRKMFGAIMIAVLVAIVGGLWAGLWTEFDYGASNARVYLGNVIYGGLESWLVYPTGPNWPVIVNIGQGFFFVSLLSLMRSRFLWWPFHPVGYLMGNDHTTNYFWFPFLLAWAVKVTVLRIGGLRAYRRTIPIAIGIILGEFAQMTIWSLIGIALDTPTYSHFIHPTRP